MVAEMRGSNTDRNRFASHSYHMLRHRLAVVAHNLDLGLSTDKPSVDVGDAGVECWWRFVRLQYWLLVPRLLLS